MAEFEGLENEFLGAYKAHSDALFRYCFFKLSNRDMAKDALQEVYLRFWQYRVKGNHVDNPRAFLFTTASNYIKDQWKKKKAIPIGSMSDPSGEGAEVFDIPDESDSTVVSDAEYRIALDTFSDLSDEDQLLLQLRFVEDLAVKDIAEMLRERENTISVRISRALGRLRKKFKYGNE